MDLVEDFLELTRTATELQIRSQKKTEHCKINVKFVDQHI